MKKLIRIPINTANILFELFSPLSAVELGIEKTLSGFFGTPKNPQLSLTLNLEISTNIDMPSGELIYDPGAIFKIYQGASGYYIIFSDTDESQAESMRSLMFANSAWDTMTLVIENAETTWQSLPRALELVLRTVILYTHGIIFHSAGFDDNGKGIVFVGHAGAGKSTQADLWLKEQGVIAMNDDRMAIRIEKNGSRCYGLPWGGTANIIRNHAAPLKALIILEQAVENSIHMIQPSKSAALLAARTFLPFWDKTLMSLALNNLNAILDHVPVYRLRCRPEKEVLSLVRSVL